MSIQNPVKRLLMTITQGVYVIGVTEGDRKNAFTASSVMQVSLNPPMLALAVNPHNASFPMLVAGGLFAITVLRSGQQALADFFGTHSGRDENKLASVQWHPSPAGAPVLDDGLSYLDCRALAKHPAGDHVIIVAEVTGGDFLIDGKVKEAYPLRYDELGDMDGSDELLPYQLGAPEA